MKYRINLISDTVTKPTPAMLNAMLSADLGDDVFKEDPTVAALESKMAAMFSKEAGLFCPSGTMTNQIAIKAHTVPMDEMICETHSHVFQYEVGGYAFHSGIAVNPIPGINGKLNVSLVEGQIKATMDWLPRTRLVVIENTCNRAGGQFYTENELRELSDFCKKNDLVFHCDGARVFNALLESHINSQDYGEYFDSISICLSKGLGAPVGSVLVGTNEMIQRARRIRKVMGGGMRQAGIIAAAGIYALDHHIERLAIDHVHAKRIEIALKKCSFVKEIIPVQSNIVIFALKDHISPNEFIEILHQHDIHASAFGKNLVRFVTHLDIQEKMVEEVCFLLESI